MDANHSEMVKFAKATDNNYKTFKQIIQKIIRVRIDGGAVENGRLTFLTLTNVPFGMDDGNQAEREV